MREFVEKPRADQIDTNLISRRRLRARARRARPDPAGPQRLDRARGLAARSSATASTASPPSAYWLDIGTPERYLQGTFDILEGNVRTAVAERLGDGFLRRRRGRRVGRADRAARRRRARLHGSPRAPTSAALVVLGDGRAGRRGLDGRARGRAQRRRDRRGTACCATASCAPARASATDARSSRRRGARRGRDDRRAATCSRAGCKSSPARARTRPSGSEPDQDDVRDVDHRVALDRDDVARSTRRPAHRRARHPRAPARRAVEGRVAPAWSDWDSPGGLVVAGMGGSAIGGELARARSATTPRARSSAARAYGLPPWTTPDTTVLCASYSGNTEETLAALRGRRRARRAARRRHDAAASSPSWRAPTACPSSPSPAACQPRAAVAYMTVAVLEVAAARRRRPAPDTRRSTSPPTTSRSSSIEWGPGGADDATGQGARPRAARVRPGRSPGAGLTDADRLPLEDADQRERQDPRRSRSSCPRWTTTRSSAGAGARASGRFSRGLPRRRRHAPARQRSASSSRGRLIQPTARPSVHHVSSRGQHAVERVFSLVLLGDLVSLYLAVLRGVDPSRSMRSSA